MLDEAASRKPGFDEVNSVPIVLADGREWWFPLPPGELIIVNAEGDFAEVASFGPAYDAKVEALAAAQRAGDGTAVIRTMNVVAMDLLGRNYHLDVPEFRELLVWKLHDEANQIMWTAIVNAARGIGEIPKTLARYLHVVMIANGVRGRFRVQTAVEVVGMLVATGRAIHPSKWVDEMVAEQEAESWASFGPA